MSTPVQGPASPHGAAGGSGVGTGTPPATAVTLSRDGDGLLAEVGSHLVEQEQDWTIQLWCNGDVALAVERCRDRQIRFAPSGAGYYQAAVLLDGPAGAEVRATSSPLAHNLAVTHTEDLAVGTSPRVTRVAVGAWEVPTLVFPGKDPNLFVLLHGPVDRDQTPFPHFDRWTWARDGVFPGHVLCLADPTLELAEEMRLGWYFGTIADDATDSIVGLSRAYAAGHRIPEERIVFWGSSGGGFAALSAAARVPGSRAVAVNPQVDPLRYDTRNVVEKFVAQCLHGQSADELPRDVLRRTDLMRAWADDISAEAWLIVNESDEFHFREHFSPFWSMLGGQIGPGWSRAGQHHAWVLDASSPPGHESREMASEIVSRLPFVANEREPDADDQPDRGADELLAVVAQLADVTHDRLATKLAEVTLLAAGRQHEILALRRALVEARTAEAARVDKAERTIKQLRKRAARARRRGEQRVRGSARFQLGSLLVESAQRPWLLIALPVRLVRLAIRRRTTRGTR